MEEKDVIILKKPMLYLTKFNRGVRSMKNNPYMTAFILLSTIIFIFSIIIINLFFSINKIKESIYHDQNDNIKKVHFQKKTISKFEMPKKLFHYKDDNYDNIDKNKKKIHISYSLDDKLIYPTLVSMLSGLENNNNSSNILIYHLLLSHNFSTSNIEIFESLKENYEVKINYYIIPPIFSNMKSWTKGTDCVYYKIILPLMFPELKRIIYLDGDTLIRKDILEMYEYPFNDNYILGHPFYMPYVMDKYGINATHYINGGCLLFNIEKIRKDKKDIDLLHFTIDKNDMLRFREQDSINYVFYPKIGFLPLKYGIYMIGNEKTFDHISRLIRSPVNLTEGYEAITEPSIVHFSCCWPKVWEHKSENLFDVHSICTRYRKEFYYYAKKSKYYSDIYDTLYKKLNRKKKKI